MTNTENKTVNTRSLAGLRMAEELKAQGWKIKSIEHETLKFEREKKQQ